MVQFFKKKPGLLYGILAVLIIAIPLFGHLDEQPIERYDEMRNAQSALEMNHTGRLIVTTFQCQPETWSTKPPLFIWILALSQRLLGYNETALRLPSALAAALICLMLFLFAHRRTGSWLVGFLTVLVLVTTQGFLFPHAARAAEYDALLTCFTTASMICLVNFVEENNARWLWLSALALIGAVMTKGVVGFFIAPALLGYALVRRKGMSIIRCPHFYVCLVLTIVTIGGYYWLREMQQPGYLQAVWDNELGGRYNTSIENHKGDIWFYYYELKNNGFKAWAFLVIPACLIGLFAVDKCVRNLAVCCVLASFTILVIISTAATNPSCALRSDAFEGVSDDKEGCFQIESFGGDCMNAPWHSRLNA